MTSEIFERQMQEKYAAHCMKRDFSRIGWAVFLTMTLWFLFLMLVSGIFAALEANGVSAMAFYERYLMVFNELGLCLGMTAGMVVLKPLTTVSVTGSRVGWKRFLKFIAIGFFIAAVGNILGTTLLGAWNGSTGNTAGGEVEEMISETDSMLLFLMAGLCAPFLEELFFRKLLCDATRKYGERTTIVTSAVLFGLFHGNFTQFFYAAGLGALLAYVYLRSGSFLSVFGLHAAFNILSGFLPTVLMQTEQELPYMVYVAFYVVMVALGFILFLMNIWSVKLRPGEVVLSKRKAVSSVLTAIGMIAAGVLLLVMMVMSLFTA